MFDCIYCCLFDCIYFSVVHYVRWHTEQIWRTSKTVKDCKHYYMNTWMSMYVDINIFHITTFPATLFKEKKTHTYTARIKKIDSAHFMLFCTLCLPGIQQTQQEWTHKKGHWKHRHHKICSIIFCLRSFQKTSNSLHFYISGNLLKCKFKFWHPFSEFLIWLNHDANTPK